jgi:hypothetical protein
VSSDVDLCVAGEDDTGVTERDTKEYLPPAPQRLQVSASTILILSLLLIFANTCYSVSASW